MRHEAWHAGVGHLLPLAGIGWDIDDHSRVSFASIKPDEGGDSCAQVLRERLAYYKGFAP